MNNITTITLTGADERTPLDGLVHLAAAYPAVEIGLLFSASPEGRNRYPSMRWLLDAARALRGRAALHVCGSVARRALLDGALHDLTIHTPRVQVNGRVSVEELPVLARQAGTLITQHNALNAGLLHLDVPNHSLLIDASGGRGITPDGWEDLATAKPVGRAGGMGPHNLLDELDDFAAVARPGAWVDMEGRLRTNDWFNIDTALQCAATFHLASMASTPLDHWATTQKP